jgi:hypothetical protein
MPFYERGNARDYIRDHPECDCLRIVIIPHISNLLSSHLIGTSSFMKLLEA